MSISTGAGTGRRRLLGVGFLLALIGLLAVSVLTYRKAFTPVTTVTLRADTTGTQLLQGADVKIRGLIVGEVREISSDGRTASLRLALDPDQATAIPANVTARLLPKTLFGEKFVELQIPTEPAARSLREGDVIGQDRSSTAIELERVLDDLLPLLRTVQPAKLNATLNALATALSGRGDELGANLVRLGDYLQRLNAEMPTIQHDFRQLATTLETYAEVAPDLLAILRDSSVTLTTVAQQRAQLEAFFTSTTRFGDYTARFLTEHAERLIQVADVSRPILETLAVYSPEFPCLAFGLTDVQPRLEETFGGGYPGLHITLEIAKNQGKYERGRDEPVYGTRAGPHCRGLPDPVVPFPGTAFADGYDRSGPRGPGEPPLHPPPLPGLPSAAGGGGMDATMGYTGTAAEQEWIAALLAPVMTRPAEEVPDIATLLFGPLARGTAVSYQVGAP